MAGSVARLSTASLHELKNSIPAKKKYNIDAESSESESEEEESESEEVVMQKKTKSAKHISKMISHQEAQKQKKKSVPKTDSILDMYKKFGF